MSRPCAPAISTVVGDARRRARAGDPRPDVRRSQPGKILGLVGESGAGKSMIGRTIAQLLPPGFAVTGGSLPFDGDDLVTHGAGERAARCSAARSRSSRRSR